MTQAGLIDGEGQVIEVRDLTRRYGKFTAVDHVSFDVGAGEIFGFLGPNGAGKTTTISVLTTLLKPSGGSARISPVTSSSGSPEG